MRRKWAFFFATLAIAYALVTLLTRPLPGRRYALAAELPVKLRGHSGVVGAGARCDSCHH